jgi:hypothetical protein
MTAVLDPETAESPPSPPVSRSGSRREPPRRRRHTVRNARAARWLAVLVLGFVVGAAVVLYADGGSNGSGPSVNSPAGNGSSGAAVPEDSSAGSATPTDLNGHHVQGVKARDIAAESEPDLPLDAATRDLLAQQLVIARDTAMRYPTAADAERGGYRLVAGFGPGSGAHYIGGPMTGPGPFDPTRAQSLIYDGTSPTSRIVGLMYFGFGGTAPEGFAGPNDHWHRHSNVCTKFQNGVLDVPFPPDADVTQEQCASVGGRYMAITGWMVHAWVVPGWESPAGVFSHENPNLRCADGTYDTDAVGRCQGT